MKLCATWSLLLCVSAAPVAGAGTSAFDAPLSRELDRCINLARQRYQNEREFDFSLRQHCPALARLLTRRDFGELQQAPGTDIDFNQMLDLRHIDTILRTPVNASPSFDRAALPQILQTTLRPEPQTDLGGLRRFLDWLAEKFDNGAAQPPDWLRQWLEQMSVPPWLTEALYYALVLLLGLLLLAVVVTEFRAAGGWRGRRRRVTTGGQDATRMPAHAVSLTWDAMQTLPPADSLLACYHKLLQILTAHQLLPTDSSLTNRELQATLEAALGAEQVEFRRLLRAVDGLIYGGRTPEAAAVSDLVRDSQRFAAGLASR